MTPATATETHHPNEDEVAADARAQPLPHCEVPRVLVPLHDGNDGPAAHKEKSHHSCRLKSSSPGVLHEGFPQQACVRWKVSARVGAEGVSS